MYLLFAILFVSQAFADGEWWSTPRSEDEKNYYYVGVAEGKEGVAQLQDKAFNKAMGELIREHFGMSIQINESAVEELQKQQFHVITKQSSAPLFIKGVGIVKTREKDLDDDGYRVYVQIQADKKSVADAVKNQTSKPGNDSLNTFGESHDSKTDITVKTHPQGALIHFSHLDRRYTLQGQGDARFFLPRGRYQMVVSSPGYATVKKEVELRVEGLEENIILEELNGVVDLEVYPDDARIVFESNKVPAGKHKLQVGKFYRFTVSHPDYFSKELELVLEHPETVTKVVKLEPKPSTLKYEVYPSNATIKVDGQQMFNYRGTINVDPGRKNIVISAPGYLPYEETVYVGTNRDYPLKVVRLEIDDLTMPPSNKGLAYRIELNPLFTVSNVGYGGIGLGLHVEYKYISFGGGFDFTQYKETKDNTNSIDNANKQEIEKSASDAYLTARLITPQFGLFKFFASGTVGTSSREWEDKFNKKSIMKESKNFHGFGGGVRMYITPKWSMQAEYFDISTTNKETKDTGRESRGLAGFVYEF